MWNFRRGIKAWFKKTKESSSCASNWRHQLRKLNYNDRQSQACTKIVSGFRSRTFRSNYKGLSQAKNRLSLILASLRKKSKKVRESKFYWTNNWLVHGWIARRVFKNLKMQTSSCVNSFKRCLSPPLRFRHRWVQRLNDWSSIKQMSRGSIRSNLKVKRNWWTLGSNFWSQATLQWCPRWRLISRNRLRTGWRKNKRL